MNGIIDLREIAPDTWQAKYQGNYGVYTIKISTDGKRRSKFSCSCPSDYYPCKHIAMVEEAIAEQIAINKKLKKTGGLTVKELLKGLSRDELCDFIIRQAQYNSDLHNAITLEFTPRAANSKGNKYSPVIRKALQSVYVSDEINYEYEQIALDVLDQWFDKAWECVDKKQYAEAILICKACIEEFAAWLNDIDEDITYCLDPEYQSVPFEILEASLEHADKKELFAYCRSEQKKKKYAGTDIYDYFHRLLMDLAVSVDPDAFIALQDELLAGVADIGSHEAETILRRKINFYKQLGQPKKAWDIIEANIRIESFRREMVEKKIAEKKFVEAKKFINDYITGTEGDRRQSYHGNWNELLLDIAQKENDIPAIRKLSYEFLSEHFSEKYFGIYKAAFNSAEWAEEMEKLLCHYGKNKKHFSDFVAQLLAAENAAERLMDYVEKYLSLDYLDEYHRVFATAFPEKTLELFRNALNTYAENNVGRSHYEYILKLLKKMSRIKGGEKTAADLAADFKTRYKNRKAMHEVLKQFV